jgi:hypothetical protein
MKTHEALTILRALNTIAESKRMVPTKFAYASAINRKRMAEVAEAFEAGRVSLVEKYVTKDADGKPLTDDKGQLVIADKAACDKEYADLAATDHPELKLHQIPLAELPAEIEMEVMDALMPMIQQDAP